jgi:type VI secretion system Hcp family effector
MHPVERGNFHEGFSKAMVLDRWYHPRGPVPLCCTLCSSEGGKNTIGYLSITGVTEGCSDVKNNENSCLVYGFQQGVTTSGTPGSGGGSAGRAALSLTITKPVDRASVMILADTVMGKHIESATIRLAQDGSFKTSYLLQLSDVIITGDHQYYDALNADQDNLGQLEDVTLAFGKITWVWEPDVVFCFNPLENRQCVT